MPLYEYVCEECGYRFEVIQRFYDEPLKTCPKCGGKVNKVISAPAIHFKGSGWYVTDYKNRNNGNGVKKSHHKHTPHENKTPSKGSETKTPDSHPTS